MEEYFKNYFEILGQKLREINTIISFTKNSAVIGQFTENIIMDFLRSMITPLSLSTGTVISPETHTKEKLNQIDGIIWAPNPLPAICEVNNFGLIPRNSVFGIFEVKRTSYASGLTKIADLFEKRNLYLPPHATENYFAIVCINTKETSLSNLKKRYPEKIFCLLNCNKSSELAINHEDMKAFVNFIGKIRYTYSMFGNSFKLK